MNLKSSNKIETNRWELEIEITAPEFEQSLNEVYKKQKNKISVPGFRKGKAPRNFIEKYYGEKVFFEDAINDIYPKAIDFAGSKANLEIIDDHIDFDLIEAKKEKGLIFKVKVTVMPEIVVENYKGIEVEKKQPHKITQEDIEQNLNKICEKNARYSYVEDDTPANIADIVNINFEGFCGSEAFEGGKAEFVDLTLGKNQFIEGFENQIVGHKTGEDFEIEVKFPENYHVKNLKNKDAIFKIHINSIQKCELPKLDDEFAKDVSEFDTLEEYKLDLKNKLIEKKEKEAEEATTNKIFEKFNSLIEVEIPEVLIKNKIKELTYDYKQKIEMRGVNFEEYLSYTGLTKETIGDTFKNQAEILVKSNLGLNKVAQLENIEATPDDIEKNYQEMSDMYKMDIQKIKKNIPSSEVIRNIIIEKATELIKNNAVIK